MPVSQGIIKLEGKDATTKKMREQAVTVIKMYGDALATGSTQKFNDYMDKVAADKYEKSAISLGRAFFKEQFEEKVKGLISANTTDKVSAYAKALEAVTLEEIKVYNVTDKDEFDQTFEYHYSPKDWGAFSSIYINFRFGVTKFGGNNYELYEVRVS